MASVLRRRQIRALRRSPGDGRVPPAKVRHCLLLRSRLLRVLAETSSGRAVPCREAGAQVCPGHDALCQGQRGGTCRALGGLPRERLSTSPGPAASAVRCRGSDKVSTSLADLGKDLRAQGETLITAPIGAGGSSPHLLRLLK